jgi:hypothetical protein
MLFCDMYADFIRRIPFVFIRRVFYVADRANIPSGYIELLFVFYGISPPFFRKYLTLNICALPLRLSLREENNRSTLFAAVSSKNLVLYGSAPAGLFVGLFVLCTTYAFGVQVVLRMCGNQFNRLTLRFGFDRPGLGDLKVFQMSFTSSLRGNIPAATRKRQTSG